MNIKLIVDNLPSYMNDVPEIVRAFLPFVTISDEGAPFEIRIEENENSVYANIICPLYGDDSTTISIPFTVDSLEYKRFAKREVKKLLYRYLSNKLNVSLPYGSLTGVRPTRIYYDSICSYSNINKHLIEDYYVEESRAKLIENVVKGQEKIYSSNDDEVDIFVNIPICPTRCRYCSFISTEIGRVKKLVPAYVKCVQDEINEIKQQIEKQRLKVRSIYIGGGTPTSLNADELRSICSLLSCYKVEFTVEAGRPDSITRDKLKALEECGVTRISINPQTFKDETLEILGRAHTTQQLYEAFSLAREFSFDVNMDLIAGLPGESYEDFAVSLDNAIALDPENITVHTLSLKRGSTLKEEGTERKMDGTIRRMTDYSISKLEECGYIPYYMYRQKNMADGLENVGWCKPNKQCIYNVDYMEETTSVFSAGAGAVSKMVYHLDGRIERTANPKGFEEYLRRKGAL